MQKEDLQLLRVSRLQIKDNHQDLSMAPYVSAYKTI
jgi:hypothetical protein